MRSWIVIVLVMLTVAGIRVWWMIRPVDLPTGTGVRINTVVGKVNRDEGQRWFMFKGMMVRIPEQFRSVIPGVRVRVTGVVQRPATKSPVITTNLDVVHFEIVRESGSAFEIVSRFNTRLKQMILSWLPGDAGALAFGILLGSDEGMSKDRKDAFKNSGISHVTAASGYNVTVTAGVVMFGLAKKLGRRKAIPFGILCIVLYVLLAGGSGSVTRAGVMIGLTLLGKYFGRLTDSWWMLFLSAWGMVMVRPDWIFDVGFQLSVAATVGILAIGGNLGESGWKSDIKISLAATLMTIPIILFYFGEISVWAPVVNVLVLWCVPWIMEIMLLSSAAGVILNPVGQAVAYLAWPLAMWMILVVDMTQNWPGNGWQVGRVQLWWVVVYYLVAIGTWRLVSRRGIR